MTLLEPVVDAPKASLIAEFEDCLLAETAFFFHQFHTVGAGGEADAAARMIGQTPPGNAGGMEETA